MDKQVDLLEKGFQLAYFIVPDRGAAIEILLAALNKLKARSAREKKRHYWRDKYLRRRSTTVTRQEADILQWLIYFESDRGEKIQFGEASAEDLVLRYIKNLVRMTTAMSSFYVSIGMSRLLYNYSTAETQCMYELVTERYLGSDQYRRAKNILMGKLETEFGSLLKTFKTRHGEIKFELSQDQNRSTEVVHQCLTAFTPWSTHGVCLVPEELTSEAGRLPDLLSGKNHKPDGEDVAEVNRFHAFIEPQCFGRLTALAGFDSPERKLALPRFFMDTNDNHQGKRGNPSSIQPLSVDERKMIRAGLAEEAVRRRQVSPKLLRILVDGKEYAVWDLSLQHEQRFIICEGAEIIEIWTQDDRGDLLLATHLIAYQDTSGFAVGCAAIPLERGRELVLTLSPGMETTGEKVSASLHLRYFPGSRWAVWKDSWITPPRRLKLTTVYALAAAALMAIGWFFAAVHYQRSNRVALEQKEREITNEKAARASLEHSGDALRSQQTIPAYRLIPDDLNVRGEGSLDMPMVPMSSHRELINLELPVGSNAHGTFRAALRPFLNATDILIENQLEAQKTASGFNVVFALPCSTVEANHDYTIDLKHMNSAGKLEEVNTYSFHLVNAN